MTDEADEAPAFLLAGCFTGTPGRHAGQADAVLDDVKQLMVLETLRRCQSHVRRPGVQTAPHLRVATPVVRMTRGAVIGEVRTTQSDRCLGVRYWVWWVAGMPPDGEVSHGSSDE